MDMLCDPRGDVTTQCIVLYASITRREDTNILEVISLLPLTYYAQTLLGHTYGIDRNKDRRDIRPMSHT